jgi:hypothetical protein
LNSEELKEIYASAPVSSTQFEVVALAAPWFSKTYYLQSVFTEEIEVTLETGAVVEVLYAPMSLGESSSNADLNYERTIVIQMVNDIIAQEQARFDPDIHDRRDQNVQSRGYIYYRDGTISSLQTSVIKTTVRDIMRNANGANIRTSSKPSNESSTGEVATVTRVPMLRGFVS